MIKFEYGMLVLDSSATLEDMVAVADFQEYVRNKEQERIVKLLEDSRNSILGMGDVAHAQMLHTAIAIINGNIAFVKEDNK